MWLIVYPDLKRSAQVRAACEQLFSKQQN